MTSKEIVLAVLVVGTAGAQMKHLKPGCTEPPYTQICGSTGCPAPPQTKEACEADGYKWITTEMVQAAERKPVAKAPVKQEKTTNTVESSADNSRSIILRSRISDITIASDDPQKPAVTIHLEPGWDCYPVVARDSWSKPTVVTVTCVKKPAPEKTK